MRLRPIPSYIEDFSYDLIIIGGGINGTAIARDAAMRGLNVLLLEKEDLCAGTSAWSSRLMHGGLRYLEYYEIDLVRESLRERERLFWTAPHLVKPLPFVIPFFRHNKRGPLLIRLGMIGYDILSLDKSVPFHTMMSHKKALEEYPGLNQLGLKGAALYYDGQVELAERMCIENALSAHENGATILTYARVDDFIMSGDTVQGVKFSDLLDDERTYQVKSPVVINVSGPWVDTLLRGTKHATRQLMGGTKGSHIIVDPFHGSPKSAIYFESVADGRPMFIIPWNKRYLIGCTDIRYDDDLDYIVANDEEIAYILHEVNGVIPEAKLTTGDIHYTHSGIRPLPHTADGSTASITRRHIVYDHAPDVQGLFSIIGGKLTTFRALAEHAVDAVFRKLKRKKVKCGTFHMPFPGANVLDFIAFRTEFKQKSDLPSETAERLLDIYGVRSLEILKIIEGDADLKTCFSPNTGAIKAEVIFAFKHEMAERISDVLMRRTMIGLEPNMGIGEDEETAKIGQVYFGWDDERAKAEVAYHREYIKRFRPKIQC